LRLNRLLRYLNLLIGLVLLAVLGAVYWFAWRVLPKASGTIQAPLSAAATITRDDRGTPHIEAASAEDAIFLQGYVHAQDRLWQMDAIRRFASGELSEVLGTATLETDRETRRLRLRRIAEGHAARLPDGDKKWLVAYARGVNEFLRTHTGKLPLAFTLLNYDPRPWTTVDTLVVGLHMYRDLTTSWRDEINKATLVAGAHRELIEQLFPPRTGLELQPGSNAWVLSGARTSTGKPILANDPHLQFGMPSTWYMVHLKAPGLNVSGVSLPGVPSVIIGHNDTIAWGVTNLHYDVQDLYIERFQAQTGQYVFRGAVEQAQLEREVIPVKGQKPVEFSNWVTRHGPLQANTIGQALALRWMAAEPGKFDFPFVQINMARNWEEFRAALRRFHGPGQNFVFADVNGNIGYQAAGSLPIRKSHVGDVPADGASGENEWECCIPFDELPMAWNPPSGMIVTANQNPFPAGYKYPVHGEFASHYRERQIRSLLGSRKDWTAEQMIAVQKDVYSHVHHYIAKEAAAAVERKKSSDSALTEAARMLRGWDGQMDRGGAAPMIAALVYQSVIRAVYQRAAPGKASSYTSHYTGPVVEQLLRERPKEWFADYDEVLVRALADGLDEGRRAQGRNVSGWRYGRMLELDLKHPILSNIPVLGKYFNIGFVQQSGAGTSVKQTTRRVGPSMRFVADLADWDRSLNNITIGQSGQPLSGHYKDQWSAYYNGRSFRMQWKKPQGDVLRVEGTEP
jgi:penicillin amidase